jgi:hypothetical protein
VRSNLPVVRRARTCFFRPPATPSNLSYNEYQYIKDIASSTNRVVHLNSTETSESTDLPPLTEPTRHTLTTTAQSPDIRCLMLLEMVSYRTHSGLVHLIPVRVEAVQLGGARVMMRGATGFGSSAA